jgi:hypothetical protein
MKFIKVKITEGLTLTVDRMLNVDHVIQFEPSRGREGHCHVYLSDGKVISVANTFEELIILFKN